MISVMSFITEKCKLIGQIILELGLGLIVFPQWYYRERLFFPLLEVKQAIITEGKGKFKIPPIFQNYFFSVTQCL